MSDPNRRQFLGAAASVPVFGTTSVDDSEESEDGGEESMFFDDTPSSKDLNRPSIDIQADHEVYQEWVEGQLGIRPIWEPGNPKVAQVTLSLGPARISSGLGEDEVDALIEELEHAKQIAAEYEES